jgi:dipeptidase D
LSSVLDGLYPQSLWYRFGEISAIPRPSKKEEKIAAYVIRLANEAGLDVHQDSYGNIVVRKPASAGKESAPVVALQSHLDMVCEKNRDVKHDFERDGIQLVKSDGYITASGTTLGSDNGIGVAAALAVMLDSSIIHGPLEFLFTVDEETGLTGAAGLEQGFLRSRILLNLDTEEEGALYVGCAGGRDTLLTIQVAREPSSSIMEPMMLSVRGLRGGHSGVDIHLGRGNALKIMGGILWELQRTAQVLLAQVEGGSKRNAIPREAQAVMYVKPDISGSIRDQIAEYQRYLASELASVDPGIRVEVANFSDGKTPVPLRSSDGNRVIDLLHSLPHGVLAMSPDIEGLVETSTNVATIQTTDQAVVIGTSQRSSVRAFLDAAVSTVASLGAIVGASAETTDGYPGWKPNLNSVALTAARKTYRALYSVDPEIKAIHAGLECGIIGERFPGMDMVSFGPTIEGAHSPDERVNIGSVKKFWELLIGTLKTLSEPMTH